MNPVLLKGDSISLVVGQLIRVDHVPPMVARERYSVEVVSYAYGFKVGGEQESHEILTFHWDSGDSAAGGFSPGRLHIGRHLLVHPTPIRPGDFQNAHVPTGYLSLSAFVRFAITELNVIPLSDDWASILVREN